MTNENIYSVEELINIINGIKGYPQEAFTRKAILSLAKEIESLRDSVDKLYDMFMNRM